MFLPINVYGHTAAAVPIFSAAINCKNQKNEIQS